MKPNNACRVCDQQREFPNSDVNACAECIRRLGLCLAVACSCTHEDEDPLTYEAPFVVVLRSGREIRFRSAFLNDGGDGRGDWITPNNVTSVLEPSGRESHGDEKHFYELTFRLSEVAYAYQENE